MQQRGFTWGEVGVSLGIIALLTVVLMPGVDILRARSAQTQQTDCVSNLRAMGLAYLIYAEEWDRRTVRASGDKDKQPWCRKLEPYVRDTHVFECPAINASVTYEKLDHYPVGYGINDCVGAGIDLDAIKLPESLIIIGDDSDDHTKAVGFYFVMDWDSRAGDNSAPPADRHLGEANLGGANMAFADGHVKWFPWQEIGYRDGLQHPAPPGVDYWHPVKADDGE